MRTRAEALAHVQNTISQYNLPPIGKKLTFAANRVGVAERFENPSVRRSVGVDLALIGDLDEQLGQVELYLVRHAKVDDPQTYARLQTIPGVGKILALILLYEIHDIARFAGVGNFVSYARLVRCSHESAGKNSPGKGRKIGNAHLKWAFSEAAVLMLREVPQAASFVAQREAARQGQGTVDSGGPTRPRGVLYAAAAGGLRCEKDVWRLNLSRRERAARPN